MNCIQARFNSLLSHNSRSDCPPPLLTAQLASKLIDRLERMRLFAHAYPLLTNLTSVGSSPLNCWTSPGAMSCKA